MTDAPSDRVFDSRLSPSPGVGYPSCLTDLCRVPPNRADPHGYYAEIGVPPWATPEEIRSALRDWYIRLHPDTSAEPDVARLQRIKMIGKVLLDPRSRDGYNRTPPGRRLLDEVYMDELKAANLIKGDTDDLTEVLDPIPCEPDLREAYYDYLAVDWIPSDLCRAQDWYQDLCAVAPVVGYRRRIKVLLHDGPGFFHPRTCVLAIPRRWVPSRWLAFALFTAVVGIRPGHAGGENVSLVTVNV